MVKLFRAFTRAAVYLFTKSSPNVSRVTASGAMGLASNHDGMFCSATCQANATEYDHDVATFTRLGSLLADTDFLACLDKESFECYIDLWGCLHSQASVSRYLATYGV